METKLLKGDCLELLKDIPSKSIDLVVTDPPYLLDMNGGGQTNYHKGLGPLVENFWMHLSWMDIIL